MMITIDTQKLRDASSKADAASEACLEYRRDLNERVMEKLITYRGERSSNISTAQDRIREKMNKLEKKAESFQQYEKDIVGFCDYAEGQEERLKGRISKLFGDFAKKYNINVEPSGWEEFLRGIGLGFLYDWFDDRFTGLQIMFDRLGNWYKYGGGKQIIKCVVEITLAVAAVLLALTGVGSLIATVLAIVAACFALMNGIADIGHLLQGLGHIADGENWYADRHIKHAADEGFAEVLDGLGWYGLADAFRWGDAIQQVLNFVWTAGTGYMKLKNMDPGKAKGVWKLFAGKTLEWTKPLADTKDGISAVENVVKLVNGLVNLKYEGSALGAETDASGLVDWAISAGLDTVKDGMKITRVYDFGDIKIRTSDVYKFSDSMVDGAKTIKFALKSYKDSVKTVKLGLERVFDFKLKFPASIGDVVDLGLNGKPITNLFDLINLGDIVLPAQNYTAAFAGGGGGGGGSGGGRF